MSIRRPLVLAVLASVALGAAACEAPKEADLASVTASADASAAKDVTLGACKRGEFNVLDVAATVKNSTKARATYTITVEALDAKGVRLAEASGAANAVAPGGTAAVKLVGSLDGAGVVKSCKVAQVTRF